jgi:TP901-1 family phage major tail protein
MAELGNTRRVYIVAGSGGTYTALKGEQSNSVNRSAESIDISDKDSGAWGSTMAGRKSLTVDVTVYADNTDAQQKAMLDAFYKDQVVKVFIGKLGSDNTPAEGEMFDAVITSISDTNDAGAVATRALSLASKGEPTIYPQA